MPHDKLQELLLHRPVSVSGEVKYPEKGVDNLGADVIHGIGAAFGVADRATPSGTTDVPGMIGGMAGALPGVFSMLRRGVGAAAGAAKPKPATPVTKPNLPEFAPTTEMGVPAAAPAMESNTAKMQRLMMERMDRKRQGLTDPRIGGTPKPRPTTNQVNVQFFDPVGNKLIHQEVMDPSMVQEFRETFTNPGIKVRVMPATPHQTAPIAGHGQVGTRFSVASAKKYQEE